MKSFPSYSHLELLLASKSPRRRQLLAGLDVAVELVDIEVEESYPDTLPNSDIGEYLAIKKSKGYQKPLKANQVLLTADTVVLQDDIHFAKFSNIQFNWLYDVNDEDILDTLELFQSLVNVNIHLSPVKN